MSIVTNVYSMPTDLFGAGRAAFGSAALTFGLQRDASSGVAADRTAGGSVGIFGGVRDLRSLAAGGIAVLRFTIR